MRPSALTLANAVIDAARGRERIQVIGSSGGHRGYVLARLLLDGPRDAPIFVVTRDERAAHELADDVAFFAGLERGDLSRDVDGPMLLVPEIDVWPWADVAPDPRTVALRLAALSRLAGDDAPPRIIFASVASVLRRTVPRSTIDANSHLWGKGGELSREEAIAALLAAGYTRAEIVEDPGTFAVRGAVLDVFVPRSAFPVRIEWFGDEIERLRAFDATSQRSLREVDEVWVHPVREVVRDAGVDLKAAVLALGDELEVPTSRVRQVLENLEGGVDFLGIEALVPIFHRELAPIWDHLPAGTRWFVEEPERLVEVAREIEAEILVQHERARAAKLLACGPDRFFVGEEAFATRVLAGDMTLRALEILDPEVRAGGEDRPSSASPTSTPAPVRVELDRNVELHAQLAAARSQRAGELVKPVIEHLQRLLTGREGAWDVVLGAPNVAHAERLTSILRGFGLSVESPRPAAGEPVVLGLDAGARSSRVRVISGGLARGFASTQDRVLVLSEAEIFGTSTRRSGTRRKRAGIASLSTLAVGDFIVHVVHGIGRYEGLVHMQIGGTPADFVLVAYAGTDKLYLPVHRIGEIERYAAADGKEPKLDKMGGTTFLARTSKVKSDVRQMAEELLQLYAQRQSLSGYAHPEVGELYDEFEATFPFEETPDQLDAIVAVQRDLGKGEPMDRLVCGDVGFGKTEVALRAAFRVAAAGRQVAVLAPTTVLVQQHFLTFSERMSAFPIEVGCLNRFQADKSVKRTVEGIRSGDIRIVVGTHRLLSPDVRFKDLGLVIVDEEQRFGVAQKERFKKLKTQVDVLTLSATPIPRTLHMSLLGMREISLISTPPVDRLAVRTYVTRISDVVIAEGISREMARGGQVFYVVPRIQGIEEHARRIRELVPEARVLVAHGQMPDELLERTMLDFVEHRADVLVATSIIESGLDIPRANTMFIAHADQFGLAQLYQLRGRIGRGKLRAHCYLMVTSIERLAPDATRRLEAIQRHSELGSGFNVATHDLEIRGAGDLLGKKQSGSIQAVGFETYARILTEAVSEIRGEPIVVESDPELVFDVPAFLPDDWIDDVGQRLEAYRRLATAKDADEVRDVMADLHDRYGELPTEAANYGLMMVCRTYGRRLGATSLELSGRKFSVRLGERTPLAAATAAKLSDKTSGRLRLLPGTDRIITTVPDPGPKKDSDPMPRLLASEAALVELASWANLGPGPARRA